MDKNKSDKLLASYALFKGLYDNRKDIYAVLAEYLKKIISHNGLYNFRLDEITQHLNREYEFNIPNPVVKTALGRIENLKKNGAEYSVNNPKEFIAADMEISDYETDLQKKNEDIISGLIAYVESIKGEVLSKSQRITLTHSFCNYVLDKQNGSEDLEYITSFILKNEDDSEFKEQLDKIREGVILYSGIKFNNDVNNFGAWKSELTIFIETEILFHLAGYNGELYKTLASDLLGFIEEINRKAGKRVIKLKYFEETKNEFEGFFTKARYLLEGNKEPNPSTTAMVSIINGCKASSDILVKRTDFYNILKQHQIVEDEYDGYFIEQNQKFNIVSEALVKRISEEIGADAYEYLKFLNYISIQRREANEKNFENIKSILLTGNSLTLKVTWNDLIKEEGCVPLATTMSFLTNKFWFKLNKRFGIDALPKSFDIISKSQIVLSTILNKKLGFEYEELQNQYKNGKLNHEQVKARLVDLKDNVRNPEDIHNEEVQDVLQAITTDSLDNYRDERAYFKSQAELQVIENEKIKSDLVDTKKEIVKGKEQRYETLSRIKAQIDIKAMTKYKMHRGWLLILFLILILSAGAFVFYSNWNSLEKYTYALGFLPATIYIAYFLATEKKINPLKAIEAHLDGYKKKIYTKMYKELDFDLRKYFELEEELKKELI